MPPAPRRAGGPGARYAGASRMSERSLVSYSQWSGCAVNRVWFDPLSPEPSLLPPRERGLDPAHDAVGGDAEPILIVADVMKAGVCREIQGTLASGDAEGDPIDLLHHAYEEH